MGGSARRCNSRGSPVDEVGPGVVVVFPDGRHDGDDPAADGAQMDVLRLLTLGWDTAHIGAELGVTDHTVRNYITNLRVKL